MVGGTAETDPARVTEYSEKDVMNVLAMVRKEFNIDDRRIYLMGHSQGGGGARHLAEKYPEIWAGVALLAPALFGVEPNADSKILRLPVLISVGDQDSLMASARTFSEQLKALNATVEYREFAGLDHGTIILGSQPDGLRVLREARQRREGDAMRRIGKATSRSQRSGAGGAASSFRCSRCPLRFCFATATMAVAQPPAPGLVDSPCPPPDPAAEARFAPVIELVMTPAASPEAYCEGVRSLAG